MYDDFKVFATRTEFNFHSIKLPFLDTDKVVPMGLDIGYSTVKVYSVFGTHIFPSFPIKVHNDLSLVNKETYIKYKDENDKLWYIGEMARKVIETGEIPTQTKTLYGKQRIYSDEYLVLLRLGVFFGLLKKYNENGLEMAKNVKLKIMSGLPENYIKGDTKTLKERFHGHHSFKVQLGDHDWINVSFDIDMNDDDIQVISQPFGTLWSLAANRYGKVTNVDFLKKQVLIFDGGFHTVDTFYNMSGIGQGTSSTWDDCAMHEVYRRTVRDIAKATNDQADIPIYMMDKYIDSDKPGEVFYGRKQKYQFRQDLLKNLEDVAKEAIRQLNTVYNHLLDIDILVITGGTGKAFYPWFAREFESLEGLEVVLAEKTNGKNSIDNFDSVFANVVGYFNCLVSMIRNETGYREEKETATMVAATTENE